MSTTRKLKVRATVKLNAYAILDDLIEDGIKWGWNRAHKHTATPDERTILTNIHEHIMLVLAEKLDFD